MPDSFDPYYKRFAVPIALLGAAATLCLVCCAGIAATVVWPQIARSRLNEKLNSEIISSVADSEDRPLWMADARTIAQLGPEVTFAGHAMRLPTGFLPAAGPAAPEATRLPAGGTGRRWIWVGPTSANGRRAVIQAEVREPPSATDGATYFEQTLPCEIRVLRDKHTVRAVEAGRVGGKRAVRVTYFMAKGSIESADIFRFEGRRQVVVTIACPTVDQAEFLALIQAAQLTVRQINGRSAEPPSVSSSSQPGPAPINQTGDVSINGGTEILGLAPGSVFSDQAPDGGLLIGLEVGTTPGFGSQIVQTVRPIFRASDGKELLGDQHGSEPKLLVTAKAKEDYAVGGIIVKAGLYVDGLSVVFMRVKDGKLDEGDTYESEWFGGTGGGAKKKLGFGGTPVIGIIGRFDERRCTGLGLLMKR